MESDALRHAELGKESERPTDNGGFIVQRVGFLRLGVEDIGFATDFYKRVLQLTPSERGEGFLYLTGGLEHHWVELTNDPVGSWRLGLEVADERSLDLAIDRLRGMNISFREGEELSRSRLERSIIFVNPFDGVEIELFTQMVELPLAPRRSFVEMTTLLHAVWSAEDPIKAHEFYGEVLGLRVSDWIERIMVFMRAGNRYHHSIGIARGPQGKLDHFAVLVNDIDDVMRARNNALDNGAELRRDFGRHAASGSYGVYIRDPFSGISVEFCWRHRRVGDEERPRIMPSGSVTADTFRELPPECYSDDGILTGDHRAVFSGAMKDVDALAKER